MNTTSLTRDILLSAGGRAWQSADGTRNRVYFNEALDLFGVTADFFGSGNVRSAQLDGEHISNSEFSKISADLSATKIWVDLADGEIYTSGITNRYAGYDYRPLLVAALKERIAAVAAREAAKAWMNADLQALVKEVRAADPGQPISLPEWCTHEELVAALAAADLEPAEESRG